jgi:hypothetical protein
MGTPKTRFRSSRSLAAAPTSRDRQGRRWPDPRLPTGASHAVAVTGLAQYAHLVASAGRSSDLHAGHVLTGFGSPNTIAPRRFMKAR